MKQTLITPEQQAIIDAGGRVNSFYDTFEENRTEGELIEYKRLIKVSNIIKVLHIPTGGLISDGILSCITDYMSEMDKTNFDIRVLATNDAEKQDIKKVENSGCTVVFIPYRKKNIIKYFFSKHQ